MDTIATKRDQILARTLDVERAVLGGVLVCPELLPEAQEHITPADFFREAHRLVFEAFERLDRANKPIDTLTVQQVLTPAELEDVGGPWTLSQLIDGVPGGMNVSYYARLVREHSATRALERVARHVLNKVEAGDYDDVEDLFDSVEGMLFAVRARSQRADLITPAARASATFAQIEALVSGHGGLRGVPTGLRDLDTELRGMHPGNLLLLGARPSMGKSALALTVAANAAAATQRPALFFSLEMSAAELNLREVTMRARVDGWKLTHGRVSEDDQQRLASAIQELQDGGVHLVDAPNLTVGQIRAISRRAHANKALSVVVVDYVQLIAPDGKRSGSQETRTLELGVISRQLKGLARELDVPVLLLSQLSRGVESRSDKRPQLSDLRESGSLEQDADVVLLLYRPNAYAEIRKTNKFSDEYTECLIAKQRNGPTGPVKLAFNHKWTRFDDYADVSAA